MCRKTKSQILAYKTSRPHGQLMSNVQNIK